MIDPNSIRFSLGRIGKDMITSKPAFPLSYFQLERNKVYECSLDKPLGHFEYKLYKHFLVYRTTNGSKDKFSGVWNSDYYNDNKAFYRLKEPNGRK